MKFKEVIGIDVGKISNDAIIHSNQFSFTFDNTKEGFKILLKTVLKGVSCDKEQILFVFEHTGIYSFPLSVFLTENSLSFVIVPGLEIKRSIGIQRGKNDKVDAKRIALYAFRRLDEIKPSELPTKTLITLRRLLSLRDRLVIQRASYMKNVGENSKFLKRSENVILFQVQEKMVKEFTSQIKKVDDELEHIISSESNLLKQYELITSIKGVGKQTALYMIAFTNGFTLFSNWRKFASYAGTAPFPYQSGISIHGRTKVNHLANKKFKGLLNMCATTSIICNPEIKVYYQKKKLEGKNGMSIMNAIRNKILARIFAVINRGTPYVNTYGYAA